MSSLVLDSDFKERFMSIKRSKDTQVILTETKKTLEDIIAKMPGHIYWKNKEGIYLGCNDLQAKNLGFKDPSEIIGKTDFDITKNHDMAKKYRDNDLKVMNSRQSICIEEEVLILGKPAIVVSEKVPLKKDSGEVIGVLGISQDITELKLTQEKLKKMEGQLHGMALISASISHELRTPLATIKMTSASLQDFMGTLIATYKKYRDSDDTVEYISDDALNLLNDGLDRIQRASDTSSQIINMMLTNLISQEENIIKHDLCSIKECVMESIREYSYPLGSPLKINAANIEDFNFYGDNQLIRHVLFNLMKNAFYFIEKSGKGEIIIWTESNENSHVLYFKDTSQGIPVEQLPKIFDKFYTQDTHRGTGVGLAFCKLVMERIGGSISCESEYGNFTTFILKFPKIDLP